MKKQKINVKRISEIIVQNKSLDLKCEFKIVRFGNVIASSGSVVNTFIDQFQKGGPVTLTHKEVERYFIVKNFFSLSCNVKRSYRYL